MKELTDIAETNKGNVAPRVSGFYRGTENPQDSGSDYACCDIAYVDNHDPRKLD